MRNFKELAITKIREYSNEVTMIGESWFEALNKMTEHLHDEDQTEYQKWLDICLYYEKEYLATLEEKHKYISSVEGLGLTA